jgi:predicted HAD superfamily hydrolase
VALFEHALSTGKTVVLCSDQYLPKDFIEGRLQAAGVAGYERFLLSSELGVLKITGALYDWLSVRLGVTRDQVLHIGDTEETDFRVAQQKGLAARLIPRSIDLGEHPSRHSAATRHPSVACMASAMFLHQQADLSHAGTKDVCDSPDYLAFLGYALLGPIFVGLSRWLADRLSSGDLDRLWFLSRDGEGLAKAFKLLYPELAGRVSYVFASRRLLAYSTGELKAVEVFRHFCHIDRPGTTARAFLEKAFDGEAVDELVASFSEEETLGQPGVRERVIKAIDGFIDSGALASSDRADRIRGYYRSQLKGAKRLGVFDVGWRGNLQRSLIRALGGDGSDLNIKGYYLGHIFEEEIFKEPIECESFAFDLNFPGEVFHEVSSCLWVTEFLFASTHLSVVDMEFTSGQFRPVFEELTPAKDRLMAAGRVLQESALRFVSDGIAWNKHLMLEFAGREQLVHTLREFLMRPSRADAEAFVGEQAVIGIDENAGEAIVERVVMTGDAAELRRAYHASAWKAGFRAAIDDAALSAALSAPPLNRWQRVVKMLRARLPG